MNINHRYIKIALKLVFTGLILLFVFTKIPAGRLFSLIQSANFGYIIPAFIFFIASKIFSSIRQFEIFTNEKIVIDKSYNHKIYLLGMFYNIFLPGGIGGDGYKVIKIEKDYGYTYKTLTKIIFLDRLSGLVALCNIGCILFLTIRIDQLSIILFGLNIILNAAFYFFIHKKISSTIYTIKTEVLSWLVQLMQCICAYFILQALHIYLHTGAYLFLFLLSSVAALFPFTIGGLGAREYAFLIIGPYLLLDTENAVCIGLLFYFITLSVSVLGIYYVFKSIIKTSGYASS